MKRKLPLILGIAILSVFLAMMIAPDLFASRNPYGMISLKSWINKYGTLEFSRPPFEPDEIYLMGSDALGRDVWSLLVHGTRLTLTIGLIVASLRLVMGLISGVAAGFDLPVLRGINWRLNMVFNAVPPLIISIVILKLRFFSALPRTSSILAFIGVLTFVGWARLGELVEDRTREILNRPYIASEIAVGKNRMRIALTNVLPHLAPELSVLLFLEVARVLTMMLQLGIFQVFVGNIQIIQSTDFGQITTRPIGYEPEWASMLAVTRTYIRTAPWVIVPPALAFTLSILGFNLLGEGLRARFEHRIESPKHKQKAYRKWALAGVAALALIAIVPKAGEAQTHSLTEATQLEYPYILSGVNAEEATQWMAERFEALGLEPVRDAYVHSYNLPARTVPVTGEMSADGLELICGEDYVALSAESREFSGTVVSGDGLDVLGQKFPEGQDGDLILIQSDLYQFDAMVNYASKLTQETQAGGIIIELPSDQAMVVPEIEETLGGVILVIREGLVKEGSRLEGRVEVVEGGLKGYNAVAMIPSESQVNDEAIVIGIHHNVLNTETDRSLETVMNWIAALAELSNEINQRIAFVFYDGQEGEASDGKSAYLNRPLYPANDTAVYLDLDIRPIEALVDAQICQRGIAIGDYFGWSFRHALETSAESSGVVLKATHVLDQKIRPFMEKGVPAIHLSLNQAGDLDEALDWLTQAIVKSDF